MKQAVLLLLSLQFFLSSAFVVLPSGKSLASSIALNAGEASSHDGEKRRRLAEFLNLEPLPESDVRKERLEREKENQLRFAKYGNDLWKLRSNIQDLSLELVDSINSGDSKVEIGIRKELRKVEKRDPELVYRIELEEMNKASLEARNEDELFHKEMAINARSCLPQFNLEGLWVGKYGSHGYEMINVTYAGDTLIAYKVTGDAAVPRGEITFQADLSPLSTSRAGSGDDKKEALKPIKLTEKAAKKWGTNQLPRSHGLGRVAEDNFQNAQWMEGQLIIIGEEYFSFAWLPIEHQIFFGRPSPELALKMLRDGGESSLKVNAWDKPPSQDDDVTLWKDFAAHCLERTEESIEEDFFGNEHGCIWHGVEEECYFE